jgi:hypothetical protein
MTTVLITKGIDVDIEVDLSEFEDDELVEELEERGVLPTQHYKVQIEKIWELRRTGQPFDQVLDELIYDTIGKVI